MTWPNGYTVRNLGDIKEGAQVTPRDIADTYDYTHGAASADVGSHGTYDLCNRGIGMG